jgi:hypothetical protein
MKQAMTVVGLEYAYSKFVRGDNSPEYAKYLRYLDSSDLYPEFVPRSFETYAKELLDGKAAKIYISGDWFERKHPDELNFALVKENSILLR